MRNNLTDEWAGREEEAFRAFGMLSEKYIEARAKDDLETVAVVGGEIVGLLKDRPPAGEVVNSIVIQAANLLRSGASLKFS